VTNKELNQLIGERSRAMMTIILTRRTDLTIRDTKQGTGLDHHIYIEREDKPMRLAFGLLLRGVASATTIAKANTILRPTMGQFQGMRKFTYPVCLFFFTMADDKGYFSWLAEPILGEGGPKLLHREKADCVDLTNEKLEEVVERVVAWYDEVELLLMA